MLGLDRTERVAKAAIELGVGDIAVDMAHARGNVIPGFCVEFLANLK